MNDRDIFISGGREAACRPHRLLFRYYKDRYAAMLLEDVLRPHRPLGELRKSRYGRLLDRPALKALAASKGNGSLHRDDLITLWPLAVETYVLSFATWGSKKRSERRWNQTSRPRRQLVLQLNFSRQHDEQYQRLVSDAKDMPFIYQYHPINRSGRNTMAWARIDIDFLSREALIEEVQNDWLRNVGEDLASVMRGNGYYREPTVRENFKSYAESILAPHAAMWSEAVLAASLHVLMSLCGLSRVWFHSFDTGCDIKRLHSRKPPRSLYTDLPKKFCFEFTSDAPEFIIPAQPRWLRKKLERGEGRFWRMDAPIR